MNKQQQTLIKSIRRWLLFFITALVISGITALDVPNGIAWLNQFYFNDAIHQWLMTVQKAIDDTNTNYPFLFYGYDWLAFAHIVIAVAFIGPYIDPVRNKWVIQFGCIAAVMIIPFALIAGTLHDIPFWWQVVDCSFGITALWPLTKCYLLIEKLEAASITQQTKHDSALTICR